MKRAMQWDRWPVGVISNELIAKVTNEPVELYDERGLVAVVVGLVTVRHLLPLDRWRRARYEWRWA